MDTATVQKGLTHFLCLFSVCSVLESRFAKKQTAEQHKAKSHANETFISASETPTPAIADDINPILNPPSKLLETASRAHVDLEPPSSAHWEQLLYNEGCIWGDTVPKGDEHELEVSQHDQVRDGLDSEAFPRYGASQDREASSVHDIHLAQYILANQYNYSLYWQISIV